MFAIDHAATALLLRKRYPSVPMAPLLLSVQAMELAWVALNYLGLERTTTNPSVRSVADIHLAFIPYSHSIATSAAAAFALWLILEKGFHRPPLGRALGLGVISHLLLDLLTHAHDIALWPGARLKVGIGLYDSAPMAAFFLEMAYGILCWAVFRRSGALLAVIIVANLANLSFLSATIPGPEQWFAGRPLLLVTAIFAQIVITLTLVGILASRSKRVVRERVPAPTSSSRGLAG